MTEPAENSTDTTAPGRPFRKGESGNPGGRPRGLARQVREVLGADGEVIARFWGAVLSGYLRTVDPVTGIETYEKVEMRDRIAVSKLLSERGWGKPPQFMPIEDDNPLDFSGRESAEMATSLDARLDELAARRAARGAG